MRQEEVWIQLQRLTVDFNSPVVLADQRVAIGQEVVDAQVERVQLLCPLSDGEGLVKPPHILQMLAVPGVGGRVVWIQLDGSLEFSFSPLPIPFVKGKESAKRCMSFGE